MSVKTGKDNKGCFAVWGDSGKKYYYSCNNKRAKNNARGKALKQGIAIKASQNK